MNMVPIRRCLRSAAFAAALSLTGLLFAQVPRDPTDFDPGPPPDGGPGFDGPPPFNGGGFGPGGPGGMMQQETKLVKRFDQDGNGWLNRDERKAAREFLSQQGGNRGPRGFGGRRGGFGGPGGDSTPPQPGPTLLPADVKSYPDAPLYDPQTLRTFFLEFENPDWEKELADFKNTDVEVPARLTVDGRTYPDVGVHFHGMSSFMMVGEGQKRSLVLSLDLAHKDQRLGGYRTLNLLNSHEDPSFVRTVLAMDVARDYLPAPKANFARVVINGRSWGIYVNQQHFNKDFVKDWFGTAQGARWKVPGSPGGRGGLNYLGDDVEAYRRIYELKTKEDPKSWARLIGFCKVLQDTPTNQLEEALAPWLDIDGALKFLAWDNVLANGDGFWTRASDYDLYVDVNGRFHIIPYDANETFSSGGGPGGFGPGGGPGGFGPGMFLAPQMLAQADRDTSGTITKQEFLGLGHAWFDKLDPDKTGKVTRDQFTSKLGDLLPFPQGFGPGGGGGPDAPQRPGRGRGGFGPAMFVGPGLFGVLDADHDGSLSRAELEGVFAQWFVQWDTAKSGALEEGQLRAGLNAALPQPSFGGPGGGPGGFRGGRGRGGPGFGGGPGGPGGGGVNLDPLVDLNDSAKPLLAKLLVVPSLRTRYLGYVRDMAEKWLDWGKLGPVAERYQALIAEDVKTDTRKLDSTEAFAKALVGDKEMPGGGGSGGERGLSLKAFAEKRRAYLLGSPEVKRAGNQ